MLALVVSLVALFFSVVFKGADWLLSHIISEAEVRFYWESWETFNVTPPPYAKMAINRRINSMEQRGVKDIEGGETE